MCPRTQPHLTQLKNRKIDKHFRLSGYLMRGFAGAGRLARSNDIGRGVGVARCRTVMTDERAEEMGDGYCRIR